MFVLIKLMIRDRDMVSNGYRLGRASENGRQGKFLKTVAVSFQPIWDPLGSSPAIEIRGVA
jgi:hypothetical protein